MHSPTLRYHQDALNRRVAKEVNGTIVEKYLWEDLTTLLALYDKNDNLLWRFEYADGRMPVAMRDANGAKYYLHYDQVGSLRAVSDTNGNVVKAIAYDTYGNILRDTNPGFTVPFGFASGLYDPDTKLTHFGFREYDSFTGKWTAKDPIGFAGGDSNLYGYVLGDPVNLVDPFGTCGGLCIGAAIIGGSYIVYSIYNAWSNFFKKVDEAQKAANACAQDPLNPDKWKDYNQKHYKAFQAGGGAALSVPGTSATGPVPTSALDLGIGGASTTITNSAGLGN